MKELVTYSLDGTQVMTFEVEVPEASSGLRMVARRSDGTIDETTTRFDQAIAAVRPAVEMLLSKLAELPRAPREMSIEFGVKMTLKAGAIIASSAAEANFKVTLLWKRDEQQ